MSRFVATAVIACLVLTSAASAASGEGPEDGNRKQRLNRMKEFVRSLSVVEVAGDRKRRTESRSSAQLVLIYSDPARETSDSGLWIWTRDGRPVAATALEYFPYRPKGRQWSFEFASLSPNGVTMRRGERSVWKIETPATVQQPFSSAPEPSRNRLRRLQQMKQLARRVRAVTLSPDSGRIELRLLPNPVYRCPKSKDTPGDGAVFVFAYGTNPEVLLLVEAVGEDDPLAWKYGLAPLTSVKTSVSLDGAEVWTQPQFTGRGTRDTYTNGRFSTDP